MSLGLPAKLRPVFLPKRFKVLYGGRGSGKSWGIAIALLTLGASKTIRILCAREFQTSIRDSVHRLLSDQIDALGLGYFYTITKDAIVGLNGTEFLFKGLHHNVSEIKSMEGIDICWVEEAEKVSSDSWDFLLPTIRKQGSEVWITFNPYQETDPTYIRFVLNPPRNAFIIKMNYTDNPWFPETLREEMEHCKATDPDKYEWIWLGKPRGISKAQVFKGKFTIDSFTVPKGIQLFHGADWGFAADPTTLVQCFILDRRLYISQEAYGVGVELDHIPTLFDQIPGSRRWPIIADNARPETISHLERRGFRVRKCDKWPGSVEDGIEFLRNFDQIIIHPTCKHTAQEFELYSYKQDRVSGDILPVIIDAHNHCIDAIRYALGDYIIRKTAGAPKTDVRRKLGV